MLKFIIYEYKTPSGYPYLLLISEAWTANGENCISQMGVLYDSYNSPLPYARCLAYAKAKKQHLEESYRKKQAQQKKGDKIQIKNVDKTETI